MQRRDQREFDAFVHAAGERLLHTADLLTGDPEWAERRVRRALAHTCLQWRHAVERDPTRIAYRALLTGYLDAWRPLPWRPQPITWAVVWTAEEGVKEGVEDEEPEEGLGWKDRLRRRLRRGGKADGSDTASREPSRDPKPRQPAVATSALDAEARSARFALLSALDRLTRLERAAVVLRAYARFDEFDTAELLRVPVEEAHEAYEAALPILMARGRRNRGRLPA